MTTQLILYGILIHLFCDWFLQNDWMARNKAKLSQSWAGWVHGLIHLAGLVLVFPYWWAVVIALLHIIIDTRKPLAWWRRVYRQTTDPANPASLHVAMWEDQVAHFIVIALVALLMTVH